METTEVQTPELEPSIDVAPEQDPRLFGDTWESILTPRQRQVALMLGSGKSTHQIADDLGCSVKTIDTHRGEVLKRTRCRNAVELCLLLVRAGLIPL